MAILQEIGALAKTEFYPFGLYRQWSVLEERDAMLVLESAQYSNC